MTIPQTAFLTFVDISRQINPAEELVGLIHSRRERVIGAVQIPYPEEKESAAVYCLLLKSVYDFEAQGDKSVMVYYLDSRAGEVNLTEKINDILSLNQVKVFEATPDPPKSFRQRQSAEVLYDTLSKNEWHQYLERKIKELGTSE